MKIIFLCGSLEPGKDGVGDYSRRLAGECIRLGHSCALVALNDKHLSGSVSGSPKDAAIEGATASPSGETQHSGETPIQVLRLAHAMSWKNRIELAGRFIDAFEPDWISLQYVPFSFSNRGLPFGLSGRIKEFAKKRKGKAAGRNSSQVHFHLMFHELWVGLGDSPPFKHRILGYLQQRIVTSLIKGLQPQAIHTQTTPYAALIAEMDAKVERLPLFGNIPVIESKSRQSGDPKSLQVAYFGSVHPDWHLPEAVGLLKALAEKTQKTVRIIAIGRGGAHAAETWNQFREAGISVEETGSISPEEVSETLSRCDIGLSSSCPDLIEKSGSAIAMFEHGLRVLMVRPPIWGDRFLKEVSQNAPLAVMSKDDLSEQVVSRVEQNPKALEKITAAFLSALEKTET